MLFCISDASQRDKNGAGDGADEAEIIVSLVRPVLLDVAGRGDDERQRQLDLEKICRAAGADELFGLLIGGEEVRGLRTDAKP